VAVNHFFSPSCMKKKRRPTQVMVNRVTLHLHRFHLSSQRCMVMRSLLELRVKGPPNIFFTLESVNLFTISNAILVAV